MDPSRTGRSRTDRTLVIDSSLSRRIAAELKGRGRRAVAVAELGLGRASDPELLKSLARRLGGQDWLLVTADDWLPAEQADLVASLDLTLATVVWAGGGPAARREQEARETCHRWAHAMAAQAAGSARRYRPDGHRPWSGRAPL